MSAEIEVVETDGTTVHIEPDETAARIRAYLYANPELVYDEYRTEVRSINGCCYIAAESYYHARGGQNSGLEIYCLSWNDVGYENGDTHWFLREGEDGPIVDLGLGSCEEANDIPYSAARHRTFITGYENPSDRTQTVLDAVADTGGEGQ